MKEYSIEVNLTPHPWDNKNEPYFWWIKCYDEELAKKDSNYRGHNTGACGWGKTPEDAWKQALAWEKTCKISQG